MRAPTSIGPSTMANNPLATGDRWQDRDLVAGRDAGVPAGVLAVDREGQGVAHWGEFRVPLREERPQLVQRDLSRSYLRLAGPRPVRGRAEEQHLHGTRVQDRKSTRLNSSH